MPDATPFLDALLARVDAVLVQPSHAGNVGAAARALKVMGLRGLAVVAPRQPDFARHAEAVAFASGAQDVLAAARAHPTLDDALASATLAIAVSAAGREFAAPALDPEQAARCALDELLAHPSHRVAFVFGTERTGLSIAQAQRCQLLASIPTAPGYGSLNLAQAVQVIAYCVRREWIRALIDGARSDRMDAPVAIGGQSAPRADAAPVPTDAQSHDGAQARSDAQADGDAQADDLQRDDTQPYASLARIEGLHAHLERALVDVGFLDPAAPKRLVPRLRRLLARTRLTDQEVDILRGICGAMQDCARRARASGGSGTRKG